MKLHEFYAKYANIPLSGENSRFLKRRYFDWNQSPDDLYQKIKECENRIEKDKRIIEELLEVADVILTPPNSEVGNGS